MSTKPQIELFLENESGTQQVAYPFVESDHVSLTNGMDIDTMIRQDVSMPTVVHEDLSFKVGVGDQNVSSAIVDSSVAEMTIKGKTYQNILPEPSTHVLSNNKEMFKVNEGLDPNVEIVDGVSKSAILSGKTLVNVFDGGKDTYYTYSNGVFTNPQGADGRAWDSLPNTGSTIKANTKYLVKVKNLNDNRVAFNIKLSNASNSTLSVTRFIEGSEEWMSIITSPSNANGIFIKATGTGECKIMLNVIEYQEGMENWDIPYFTGMQSVKMPVLTTIGKNLFDINIFKNQADGYIFPYDVWKLQLKPNTIYMVNSTFTKPNDDTSNYDSYGAIINGSEKINYIYHWNTNGKFVNRTFTTDDTGVIYLGWRKADCPYDVWDIVEMQIEEGSTATTYEPYKSNILTVNEPIELRGIGQGSNRVEDELNCLTGEVTERIGEYQITGEENWDFLPSVRRLQIQNPKFIPNIKSGAFACDILEARQGNHASLHGTVTVGTYYIGYTGDNWLRIILGEDLTSLEQGKEWLKANKPTIQYQLKTESIKTVDLSSSGNWEKVVLDGSENWLMTNNTHFYTMLSNELSPNALLPIIDNSLFAPKDNVNSIANAVWYGGNVGAKNGNIVFNVLDKTLEQFKQYLSQNPITVWYPTQSHKDSTQVKQPIFFKDGHIIQSSGADNSLIPTLDYQAKTSNSYVMDLMKTNTKYTMKAKSANGTFTIDGTSYGAGTNGTFTTPSSMTNKFLVMSNNANEEIMILEGDVTDKTIPYFKGIKSAFENEDKIEVLSTGKNLFDGEVELGALNVDGKPYGETNCVRSKNFIRVEPKKSYVFSNDLNYGIIRFEYDENYNHIVNATTNGVFTTQKNTHYIKFRTIIGSIENDTGVKVQLEKSQQKTTYEPYKSNNTKIPLLSPLRSLPNGVCDELIIDRMKKKATLIQRVGKLIHHGQGGSVIIESKGEYHKYGFYGLITPKQNSYNFNSVLMCDTFMWNDDVPESQGEKISSYKHTTGTELRYVASPNRTPLLTESYFRDWLSRNPVTVYYELETPVITEVDLEGFPYIYKDGHIFLNGEVTPVTEIKYSINQQHQIEASNQDIMRHQKEIDYLYKLIGEYVRVDYKNTLLLLNLELK